MRFFRNIKYYLAKFYIWLIFTKFFPKAKPFSWLFISNLPSALHNAEIAFEEGADGAFLIQMEDLGINDLDEMYKVIHQEFFTWWIGINDSTRPVVNVFDTINPTVSGLWTDDARIMEWPDHQPEADIIQAARSDSKWNGLYFGGVALKGQRPVQNIELAAKIATQYMDVVTTSGRGTGFVPEVEKIRAMKAAIGKHPLGIASGISPDNVHDFTPIADAFLVATSLLEKGTENFDCSRVRDLVQAVRGSTPQKR